MATESIHVTALIPASPEAVYDAWLSTERHAQMTGGGARIDPQVGGSHSAWGDYIAGKTLELVPGARIVQSWRTLEFPAGAATRRSTVTLEAGGRSHARITIAHTDIPEGQGTSTRAAGTTTTSRPMAAYFSTAPRSAGEEAARASEEGREEEGRRQEGAGRRPAAKKKAAARKAAKRPAAEEARRPEEGRAKKAAEEGRAGKKAAARKPAAKKAARKPAGKKAAARKPAPAAAPAAG